MKPLKVQVIGKSGRLDAIVEAVYRSARSVDISIVSEVTNPGLREKGTVLLGQSDDLSVIEKFGTPQLVQKRTDHMDQIFGRQSRFAS